MKNKSGQLKSTPETDAVEFQIAGSNHFAVHVIYARKLERERDEARNECKALWDMVDTEKKKTYNALRERDEAREALRTLAEHGESEIQRLTKERDETREQATEQFIAAGKAVKERDEAREQAARWLARLQEEGLEEYGN